MSNEIAINLILVEVAVHWSAMIIRVPKQLFVRGELPSATAPWKVQSLLPPCVCFLRGVNKASLSLGSPCARESGPAALLHLWLHPDSEGKGSLGMSKGCRVIQDGITR
ncbi:hypothetical protein TNCV_1240881 [Trichonephila clavipes]|uniref:Uncharacterized protein n=1 Tax=Trichonephila clavipes TaxID=2585209 RepID=A0A8X6WE57_TRICX|nr:hypothetical protein TNCV_1240881 [Trichonephila clavipes]